MILYLALLALIVVIAIVGGLMYYRSIRTSQQPMRPVGGPSSQQSSPLRSVFARAADVFASTEDGLYRASKSEKRWRRLPTPETMPLEGYFVIQPESSAEILYYTPGVQNMPGRDVKDKKVYGLYRSRDDGQRWQMVSHEFDFRYMFLHPGGTLYAIVETRYELPKAPGAPEGRHNRKFGIRQRVIVSADLGNSWRDITGNIAPDIQLFGIFADPDHSGLACLQGWGARGYILQAENDRYDWQMSVDAVWREQHETEETFFNRYYGSQSTLYLVQASLNNYFQYDFGSGIDVPAFEIVPSASAYTFAQTGEKPVRANVLFRLATTMVRLADVDNGVTCWGMRVSDPSGKYTNIPPHIVGPRNLAGATADSKNTRMHTISNKQPYERTIDLAQIYAFPEKGIYKVQLVYDNKLVANSLKNQWSGFFAGQTFTVTIE